MNCAVTGVCRAELLRAGELPLLWLNQQWNGFFYLLKYLAVSSSIHKQCTETSSPHFFDGFSICPVINLHPNPHCLSSIPHLQTSSAVTDEMWIPCSVAGTCFDKLRAYGSHVYQLKQQVMLNQIPFEPLIFHMHETSWVTPWAGRKALASDSDIEDFPNKISLLYRSHYLPLVQSWYITIILVSSYRNSSPADWG